MLGIEVVMNIEKWKEVKTTEEMCNCGHRCYSFEDLIYIYMYHLSTV